MVRGIFALIAFQLFVVNMPIAAHKGLSEFQLQGELVTAPVVIPGWGLVCLTDDRKMTLIDLHAGTQKTWTLPRRGYRLCTNKFGIAGVQLQDDRFVLINLGGGIIRVQERPDEPGGLWLLDNDGRMYYLKGTRLSAFNLWGGAIGEKIVEDLAGSTIEQIGDWFLVSPENGPAYWFSINEPVHTIGDLPFPQWLQVERRQGGYSLRINTINEVFELEVKAQLTHFAYRRQDGFLVWGDSRWKVFIKECPKDALVPPSTAIKGAEREVFRREARLVAMYPGPGAIRLREFLDYHLSTLNRVDEVANAVRDLLVPPRSTLTSDSLKILTAYAAKLLSTNDIGALTAGVSSSPSHLSDYMDIAMTIGMDPRGSFIQVLDRVAPIHMHETWFRVALREYLRRVGPSLPETAQQAYQRLIALLRQT